MTVKQAAASSSLIIVYNERMDGDDITQADCHSVMPVLTHQEPAVQGRCLAHSIMFPLLIGSG